MDYETFRQLWLDALRASRLRPVGPYGEEQLETRRLDRSYRIYVEPVGGQGAAPFFVTAKLSWAWPAINTLRGSTTDGEVLAEMFGRGQAGELEPEKPIIRIDVELRASAPYDKPLPLPSRGGWASWVEEVTARLHEGEARVPESAFRLFERLSWQELPTAKVVCGLGGELRLKSVECAAYQLLELPWYIDAPAERDEGPGSELAELFGKVQAALGAWTRALAHLRG